MVAITLLWQDQAFPLFLTFYLHALLVKFYCVFVCNKISYRHCPTLPVRTRNRLQVLSHNIFIVTFLYVF